MLSISPLFSKFENSDLNLLFLIKHHLEEPRKGVVKKLKWNSYCQDTCGKKCNLLFSLKNSFFLLFWTAEKGANFKFQWNFTKKKENWFWIINFSFIWWASLLTNFYMICLVFIFQNQFFYGTNQVPKNHNQCWYFRHGGETHFLVLAQTLI